MATNPEKVTKTTVDTIQFTPAEAKSWRIPPFQRELRVNDKVRTLADQIRCDSGVVPGVLSFGKMGNATYLIDGQHRREAFLLSGKEFGYADVRTMTFDSMATMGEEFVRLQCPLVRMRPDDILRGLEGSLEVLQKIRKSCPWVGYDMIRRGPKTPHASMSVILSCWHISRSEVPSGSGSSLTIARELQSDDATNLIGFLLTAMDAFGTDHEYTILWRRLNLVLCMWLYRRTVLDTYSHKSIKLNPVMFRQALKSLSADDDYTDWLTGRDLSDKHRAPAYSRITATMAKKLVTMGAKNTGFPRPPWALGKKGRQ